MSTFCVVLSGQQLQNKDTMSAFQEMMDAVADENNREIQELSRALGVSENCAADVWYLRGRSRHTQELEAELIRLHRIGQPPNMCEFGN